MQDLSSLIEETTNNLYKIMNIGRKAQAISTETAESIISIIYDLAEIEPRKYPLYFCVSCGDDFEEDQTTKPIEEHPEEIKDNFWTYTQGDKEEDHIPESICQACLD